jgi:hypothetical protein
MKQLELTSLNCPNCSANITGFEGKSTVNCDFCGTTTIVLRPKNIEIFQGNLSNENFDKLKNYIEIFQKAIKAGIYSEAYLYCNKALEINPNIGSIWENKAICSFWKGIEGLSENNIIVSNAREIRTFLNASKENDPNSDTFIETSDAIGTNLALIVMLKFKALNKIIVQDTELTKIVNNLKGNNFSAPKELNRFETARVKDYLETIETAFEIQVTKDIELLKWLVYEYSNLGKFLWWKADYDEKTYKLINKKPIPDFMATASQIDVENKRNYLVNKILKFDATYVAPEIKIEIPEDPNKKAKETSQKVIFIMIVIAALLALMTIATS